MLPAIHLKRLAALAAFCAACSNAARRYHRGRRRAARRRPRHRARRQRLDGRLDRLGETAPLGHHERARASAPRPGAARRDLELRPPELRRASGFRPRRSAVHGRSRRRQRHAVRVPDGRRRRVRGARDSNVARHAAMEPRPGRAASRVRRRQRRGRARPAADARARDGRGGAPRHRRQRDLLRLRQRRRRGAAGSAWPRTRTASTRASISMRPPSRTSRRRSTRGSRN